MSVIGLITTILEASMAIFSYFTKRAAKNDALKEVRDELSKKHDDVVQENIRLREAYEEAKKKLEESTKKRNEPSGKTG